MKRSEAEKIVRRLLTVTIKFKSDAREAVEGTAQGAGDEVVNAVLSDMYPWLFNPEKDITRTLSMLVNQMDDERPLSSISFYNVIVIFCHFLPEVTAAFEVGFGLKLPQPTSRWVAGWDPE